jgi:hypothetical protein
MWNLHGAVEEITTLRTLFGSNVMPEDHSGLRIDQCIFANIDARWSGIIRRVVHPSYVGLEDSLIKLLPEDVLEYREATRYCHSVHQAKILLESAKERISSFPKRLLKALADTCMDCLPVQPLYTIIAAYICH